MFPSFWPGTLGLSRNPKNLGPLQRVPVITSFARFPRTHVIGTASNTYTAPGITSAASRAAQSGPLQVVTTDANGNLASDGGAIFNNINILNSQMARINQNLDQLNHDVKRLDGGVAMAMALGGVYLPERQRFAIHTNVGFYNGSQALAVQAIGRINQTFTANGGVAYDLNGSGGVGGRVGISAGW